MEPHLSSTPAATIQGTVKDSYADRGVRAEVQVFVEDELWAVRTGHWTRLATVYTDASGRYDAGGQLAADQSVLVTCDVDGAPLQWHECTLEHGANTVNFTVQVNTRVTGPSADLRIQYVEPAQDQAELLAAQLRIIRNALATMVAGAPVDVEAFTRLLEGARTRKDELHKFLGQARHSGIPLTSRHDETELDKVVSALRRFEKEYQQLEVAVMQISVMPRLDPTSQQRQLDQLPPATRKLLGHTPTRSTRKRRTPS